MEEATYLKEGVGEEPLLEEVRKIVPEKGVVDREEGVGDLEEVLFEEAMVVVLLLEVLFGEVMEVGLFVEVLFGEVTVVGPFAEEVPVVP